MDTESEILDYIYRKETTGALLLTGKWGCGKTYLIKEMVQKLNKNKEYCIAVISLFGIDNTEKLDKKVKDEYFRLNLSNAGKLATQASKILDFTRKIAEASNENLNSSGVSTAVKGIEAILSINPADFISVTNRIGNKTFVLIFDDFERCKINTVDLMGTINNYIENQNIKTIIVAEEEKIENNDDYKEFKEKVISSTIKIESDYNSIIEKIVFNYQGTVCGYNQFLKDNIKVITDVFNDSKCENIRIVKSVLYDYERVYEVWNSKRIGIKNMPQILYNFFAVSAECKLGNYIQIKPYDTYSIIANNKNIDCIEDLKKRNELQKAENNKIINKYMDNTFSNFFTSLSRWIVNGIWNESDFIDELNQKYKTKNLNDMEKFLLYYPLELDYATIVNGLNKSLETAYNGELSCDQLISLIKNIHYLRKIDESIVNMVDYSKIDNGFDKRLTKIKNGEIDEPKRHTFIDDDQMDNEAKPIWEKIYNLRNKCVAWEGYREISNILKGNVQDWALKRRYSIIDVFDDELFNLFVCKYDDSTYLGKKDLIRMICELKLDDSNCSTETQIQKSKRNLEKLLCHIREMLTSESDDIILLSVLAFCKKELENTINNYKTRE